MGDDLIKKEWEWAEEFIKNTRRPQRLFELNKAKTALVIIDMQNAFLAPGAWLELPAGRESTANINTLTQACRGHGIPVIWVVSKFRSEAEWGLILTFEPDSPIGSDRGTQVSELAWDAEGAKIWPDLEFDAEKDYEVVKTRYSAFINGSSNLERLLRTLGRDSLIMTGLATNVCLGSSVMDAMMLDFKVTVVSDATTAFTDFLQQAFLMNLKMVFADVVTTAEVLKEIEQTV